LSRRRGASLERLLLRSLLLKGLALLLTRKAGELRLLLLRLLLWLSEVLRLSWIACELWLQRASSKSCRLRAQPTLEAARLLEGLLLAILGLSRSGAVGAP
jgi:hypothetical protein